MSYNKTSDFVPVVNHLILSIYFQGYEISNPFNFDNLFLCWGDNTLGSIRLIFQRISKAGQLFLNSCIRKKRKIHVFLPD